MHVRPKRMHLFTAIQLGLFVLLYVVKAIKQVAIAFPIVIALCIPIRLYLLPKIFTEKELVMMDGDDQQVMKWLADHRDDDDEEEEDAEGDAEDKKTKKMDKDPPHVTFAAESATGDEPQQQHQKGTNGDGGGDDIEAGQTRLELDLAVPLPASALDSTTKKPRRTRKKSVSCPSPHLFFSEIHPYESPPEIALAVVPEEEESSAPFDRTTNEEKAVDDFDIVSPSSQAAQQPRPRRRRSKALSCPTHILYKEADRHIAENYFFG